MNHATFKFHGALNYFLPRRQKHKPIVYEFDWRASIKDMIEAIAPPHPEVALVVVNGRSVDWDYIVKHGDKVEAYADTDAITLDKKISLIPSYEGKPKFILDTHLGRLASYLRMMGFDTLYRNDYEDDVLAEVSATENRILLTRDIGVLKRGIVVHGYFVRETKPRKRLHEINQRYNLAPYVEPFQRCMKCNGTLSRVDKASVLDQIPSDTAEAYDVFHRCDECQQIYWKGSHFKRMESLMNDVLNSPPPDEAS